MPTVAYLLSSYAALLVFCDGISIMRPPAASDLNSTIAMWFRYMLLHAGFFALVHLAFLSFFSERYRSLRRTELALSSAACAVASAFLFARILKPAPVLIDRGLIPRTILAVVVVAVPALFVPELFRRRSSENGITTTRRTAVLLSSWFIVFCFLAVIVANLPIWPQPHFGPDYWNPHFYQYHPPLRYFYLLIVPLLDWSFFFAVVLWCIHVALVTAWFPRWQGIPQRWFSFGSMISGLLTVAMLVAMQVALDRMDLGPVDNILLVWFTALLILAPPILLPTFVVFEAMARSRGQ